MKIKIIVFILASKLSLVSAQSYRELVEEKEQLLKESSEINLLLKKTEASKSVTLEDLSLLNNEINVQKNILKIFDKEINVLAIEKKNIESELIQNTADLDFLEQSYSRLLRSSHIFSLKQSPIKFFLSDLVFFCCNTFFSESCFNIKLFIMSSLAVLDWLSLSNSRFFLYLSLI